MIRPPHNSDGLKKMIYFSSTDFFVSIAERVVKAMANFDYYVSAVDYNSDDTHISRLNVHKVGSDGKFNSKPIEMTRPEVIELIKQGKSFSTIVAASDGGWKLGAKLEIIQVTTDYLKTKSDKSTKDNLENLPEI